MNFRIELKLLTFRNELKLLIVRHQTTIHSPNVQLSAKAISYRFQCQRMDAQNDNELALSQ